MLADVGARARGESTGGEREVGEFRGPLAAPRPPKGAGNGGTASEGDATRAEGERRPSNVGIVWPFTMASAVVWAAW